MTVRSTSTTHPSECANTSSNATRSACSPAAAATPGPATSTTSPSTSPWTTADHPDKPIPTTSPRCAAPITASRPSPPGSTSAPTRAPTPGPHPPDTNTTSTPPRAAHHDAHHDAHREEPDTPRPRPPPARGHSHALQPDHVVSRHSLALAPQPPGVGGGSLHQVTAVRRTQSWPFTFRDVRVDGDHGRLSLSQPTDAFAFLPRAALRAPAPGRRRRGGSRHTPEPTAG